MSRRGCRGSLEQSPVRYTANPAQQESRLVAQAAFRKNPGAPAQLSLDFTCCSEVLKRSAPALASTLSAEQLARGFDGDIDGAGAHFVDRVAFGLPDLLLGKSGAAGDILLGLLLRFDDQLVGLALGGGDDVAGLLLGFLALALVFGRAAAGPPRAGAGPRRVRCGCFSARSIERLGDHARHLHVEDDAEENDESDKRPECCVHGALPVT